MLGRLWARRPYIIVSAGVFCHRLRMDDVSEHVGARVLFWFPLHLRFAPAMCRCSRTIDGSQ